MAHVKGVCAMGEDFVTALQLLNRCREKSGCENRVIVESESDVRLMN